MSECERVGTEVWDGAWAGVLRKSKSVSKIRVAGGADADPFHHPSNKSGPSPRFVLLASALSLALAPSHTGLLGALMHALAHLGAAAPCHSPSLPLAHCFTHFRAHSRPARGHQPASAHI
eukprot:2032973-Rhodomonas_salina.1